MYKYCRTLLLDIRFSGTDFQEQDRAHVCSFLRRFREWTCHLITHKPFIKWRLEGRVCLFY